MAPQLGLEKNPHTAAWTQTPGGRGDELKPVVGKSFAKPACSVYQPVELTAFTRPGDSQKDPGEAHKDCEKDGGNGIRGGESKMFTEGRCPALPEGSPNS